MRPSSTNGGSATQKSTSFSSGSSKGPGRNATGAPKPSALSDTACETVGSGLAAELHSTLNFGGLGAPVAFPAGAPCWTHC